MIYNNTISDNCKSGVINRAAGKHENPGQRDQGCGNQYGG